MHISRQIKNTVLLIYPFIKEAIISRLCTHDDRNKMNS